MTCLTIVLLQLFAQHENGPLPDRQKVLLLHDGQRNSGTTVNGTAVRELPYDNILYIISISIGYSMS